MTCKYSWLQHYVMHICMCALMLVFTWIIYNKIEEENAKCSCQVEEPAK